MSDEDGSEVAEASEPAGGSDFARASAGPAADQPGRWIAAAAFTHPIAAHVARLKLESDGFRCYLDNEMFVTTAWLYSIATGGVKLMVREPDVEAARESLREKVPTNPTDERFAPAPAPPRPATTSSAATAVLGTSRRTARGSACSSPA